MTGAGNLSEQVQSWSSTAGALGRIRGRSTRPSTCVPRAQSGAACCHEDFADGRARGKAELQLHYALGTVTGQGKPRLHM